MLRHPLRHLVQDHIGVPYAALKEGGSHHRNMCAGHHRLQDVPARMHPSRDREVGDDESVKDGDPVETQRQFLRLTQSKTWDPDALQIISR